jgi:hypothetical protein
MKVSTKVTVIPILAILFFSFSYANAQNPPPGDEAGAQAERFKAQAEREWEKLQKKSQASESGN